MRIKKKKEKRPFFDDLAPQTKQAIAAIVCAVLGIFFVLSSVHVAGAAGDLTHQLLSYLFGIGFVLPPLACLLYVIVLLRPRENGYVSISKMIGITILLFSLLGLLGLYSEKAGGIVGFGVMKPLHLLFGSVTTGIVLGALTMIGMLLTANAGIRLPRFFEKKDIAKEELISKALLPQNPLPPELLSQEVREEIVKEEQDAEPERKKSLRERVGLGKDEFVVESFRGPYAPPPLSLVEKDRGKARGGDIKAQSNIIRRTLQNFGILVEMDEVSIGPAVTRFALKPAEGVKISRIVALQNDLELALAAHPIRIEAPIPGKSLVGIEVPNSQKTLVGMGSLLSSPEFMDSPKPLLIALGKDISGGSIFANIGRMPHLLIAGTTGSGKSVTIHTLITSLLFRNSPDQLRFILIDPKRVELTLYNNIPHLMTPVITDAKKAILSLKWAAKEMEDRYEILQQEKVRDITSYHDTVYKPALKLHDARVAKKSAEESEDEDELPPPLPYIVIIIDELADIMQMYPRELEASIVRLAQKSRAVGIHLILATQRPEVKIITGLIKANMPGRIALKVNSQIDARVIDVPGAEKLLGQGDMLHLSTEISKPIRLQSAFISEQEVKAIVSYLKNQSTAQTLDSIDLETGSSDHSDALFESMTEEEGDDELYEEAKATVLKDKKASTSYLQRKLRVGYSRAARLADLLEERGVIGPQDGARPREILGAREEEPPV